MTKQEVLDLLKDLINRSRWIRVSDLWDEDRDVIEVSSLLQEIDRMQHDIAASKWPQH